MTTAAVKATAGKAKATPLAAVPEPEAVKATDSTGRINKTDPARLTAVKRSQGARNHAIDALIALHPEDWAACRKAGREAFGIKDHTEARVAKEKAEFERLMAKYGTETSKA